MPRIQSPELLSPRLRRLAADVLVFVLVAGAALLDDVSQRSGHPRWQWIVAALLTAAVLMLRRRYPLPAILGVVALWVAVKTERAADDPAFQFVALLVGTYALGAHARRRDGVLGLVLAAAVFGVMNVARGEGVDSAVAGTIQFTVMFAFGVIVGGAAGRERALAERAARLEAERDERARRAVEDERARIARDLHDSLGHTISAIVLQVAAVRRRLGETQDEERASLLAVERSGRGAVTELRRMLGMLREEGDNGLEPVPSLVRMDELVRSVRATGMAVDLEIVGDPAGIPPGVDVAAYRIVQEALTNVLKHARASRTSVRVECNGEAVAVRVADDGRGSGATAEPGHGIIGMRERVALYGGDLRVGGGDDGFVVEAHMPLEARGG